jgi:hypothetical protein
MKKMMLTAATLVLVAACGEKKAEAPAADTAGMAPAAEAPAPADTGMGMTHDSSAMKSDTTMARDTTAK